LLKNDAELSQQKSDRLFREGAFETHELVQFEAIDEFEHEKTLVAYFEGPEVLLVVVGPVHLVIVEHIFENKLFTVHFGFSLGYVFFQNDELCLIESHKEFLADLFHEIEICQLDLFPRVKHFELLDHEYYLLKGVAHNDSFPRLVVSRRCCLCLFRGAMKGSRGFGLRVAHFS
jgi:hypothetical protein